MPLRNHTGETPMSNFEQQSRHEASSVVSDMTDKAKLAASIVAEKVEQATDALGCGMESVGNAIRQHEPNQGYLHNAGEAVAGKLVGGGQYLESHGLEGIGTDLTDMIRRNPVPALLIGFGIGFLLTRIIRA
jgi:hypothetical protein